VAPGQSSKVAHMPEGYAILKIMGEAPASAARVADPAGTLALAARGAVKQMALVSGLPEAEEALRRFAKADGWELDPHKTSKQDTKAISAAATITRLLLRKV